MLRRLRAAPRTRLLPVVAVTANAMPQDRARGLAAGFNDYLTKPLELAHLQAVLAAYMPVQAAGPQATLQPASAPSSL